VDDARYSHEIAEIYDLCIGRHFQDHYFEKLVESINALGTQLRILDVGCGTGVLSSMLNNAGHHVTGLDSSKAMLRHAALRVPEGEFIESDASQFVSANFDLVIATNDVLNHLNSASRLDIVIKNFADMTKLGGTVMFDLNTLAGFHARWKGTEICETGNFYVVIRKEFSEARMQGLFNLDIFSRVASESAKWVRSSHHLREMCFSSARVEESLAKANLAPVTSSFQTFPKEIGREFYLCKKTTT
jgi:2-polyprenyl-3-methyl-5-hydroxy-6-metoxy-1,4-benzoquinol methylase